MLKRKFDASLLQRSAPRHSEEVHYEQYNPSEVLTIKMIREFGHLSDDDDDDGDIVEKIQHAALQIPPTQTKNNNREFAFTRHPAFRHVPDEIYEIIKDHPIVVYCEMGIEIGQTDAFLRVNAGIEPDVKGRDYRFVTKAIQESEAEDARDTDNKEETDVTLGTGKPQSYIAFMEAADADTLTSVIEDYCSVVFEGGAWFLRIKDL
jgi:rhodanese-related sulfurtransferase